MKILGIFVVAGAISVVAVLSSILLIPSYATIDIVAHTGVVSFETSRGAVLNETQIGVADATICGIARGIIASGAQDLCALTGRTLIKQAYAGPLLLHGRVRVRLEQTAVGLELTAIPAESEASVSIGDTTVGGGWVVVQSKATSQRALVSFGALVSSVTIGQTGIRQIRPASLLESGTLRALASSNFNKSVIIGPSLPLGLGDVVRLDTTDGRGLLYAQSDGSSSINVSARYPATAVTLRRLGGQGVPVSFSWWERIKQDPLLVAIWAFIGFWFAVFSMAQKIVEVRAKAKGA
jgi:hypothetical protein